MTSFMQKMIGVVAVLAIVMAAASLGLVLTTPQGQQPGILGAGVGTTDWDSASIAKPGVRNWIDQANNLTRKAFLAEDLIRNLTKTLDSADRNASFAIDASTRNVSFAIDASTANITALRGNGTAVLTNTTTVPVAMLTTSWAELLALSAGQSLNITTPGAGSFLVIANLRENISVSSAGQIPASDFSVFALCDGTSAAADSVVTNSERMGTMFTGTPTYSNITDVTRTFAWTYTNATGAAIIRVCGKIHANLQNGEAGPAWWGVASDRAGRSTIGYVRLP
jgi:hypothetical protein